MPYVRNAWYVAAWDHEVSTERPFGIRILDEPIVFWRNSAGELIALEDRCAHRFAPLSLGRCEGDHLRCMYHGLLYDSSGQVVEIPGQHRISSNMRVRSYPVIARHNWIWVWMGDQELANSELIPCVMAMDRSDFVFGHGQLDYASEARLVYENLLDLSHVSFLHADSFRLSETWARQRPKVTEYQRNIRSERWFRNEGANGTKNSEDLVDSYFCCDCFVPGVLHVNSKSYPLGTADSLNDVRPPGFEEVVETFLSQAVTPVTDNTSRYFYMIGARRRGDEKSYDMTLTEIGFMEDKVMIEAQQRNMDCTPASKRFIATGADRGIASFNRIIDGLLLKETSDNNLDSHRIDASASRTR